MPANSTEEIKFGFIELSWPGEQHARAVTSLPGVSTARFWAQMSQMLMAIYESSASGAKVRLA